MPNYFYNLRFIQNAFVYGMNRYVLNLIFCFIFTSFTWANGNVNSLSEPYELNSYSQNSTVQVAPDTLNLSDSVKVILSTLDSMMTDSLSQIVIEQAQPFVPGRDGYLFPDLLHFKMFPLVYNYNYILSNLTYKEQLKLNYKSWKKFDERINFNIYRYKPLIHGLILNYYSLDYVTYRDVHYPDIWNHKKLMLDVDTFPYHLDSVYFDTSVQTEDSIWETIRNEVAFNKPSQVDLHWEQLPEPPMISDTVYMPFIRDVELDYKNFSGEERQYVRNITGFKQKKNPWGFKGYGALHTNETYVKHWAKGGENSISLLGIGRFEADYNNHGLKWQNEIELKLGALKQFGDNDFLRKSDDKLKISSKLGYRAFKSWYYTLDFDLQTQSFYGYDFNDEDNSDPISGFLSPAKTYLSIGLDYKFKKDVLSVLISPLTMKNTLVADTANINAQAFGVEEGRRSKTEAGAYIKAALKWKLDDDMHIVSSLYLFSNYVKNPQNIDVDWEGEYEYRFSHVFSLRFSVNLKYDDDDKIYIGEDEEGNKIYSKKLQIKQLMSIGFSYRF